MEPQVDITIEQLSADPFFGHAPETLDSLPPAEEMVRNLDRAGHPSSISNRVSTWTHLTSRCAGSTIYVRNGNTALRARVRLRPE